MESYLTKLDSSHRFSLCKFRCRNSKLPCVTARFASNLDDRFCKLCNVVILCDEFHYFFQCSFFNGEIKLFMRKYYRTRPNTCNLFSSRNVKIFKFLLPMEPTRTIAWCPLWYTRIQVRTPHPHTPLFWSFI